MAQLQETADQQGEEILERRHDAWVRLLSTFRAVFGGVQHERMKLLPYAGNLFDPDQFPFLEGRKPETTWRDTPATPLPIDNRTVLHLLRSLQYLELHGEARRLSFRASTSSRSATFTRACSTTPLNEPPSWCSV